MVRSISNKILWQQLHRQPRFRPQYPHERVIQFVFANFPRASANKFRLMDFGCGAGRHTVFLAENGYRAYGSDVSVSGIKFARRVMAKRNLSAEWSVLSGSRLPYQDNFFDGAIIFGVLYYLSQHQLDVIIPELYRVLKSGGKMLVTVRSTKDYRKAKAVPLGKGDYHILGDGKSRVDNEKGMRMHFFSKPELYRRLRDFSEVIIDEMSNTYGGGKFIDHDFVIQLTK